MNEPGAMSGTVGVVVPVITPVDKRENVDERAFRAVIRRCLDAGVEGIFAGGSAGLGPLLTDGQWRRIMEIAREEVDADHLLMGGVIATSTIRAIDQIRILEQIGIESMVVTPPFYIPLKREEEYVAYFGACREATDLQMVVYNIPAFTSGNIPIDAVRKMAQENWIGLIKESSGNRDYFSAMLAIGREFGVGVMQGNEPDIAWGLSSGAAGVVPVCANYEPRTFVEAVRAARCGATVRLEKAQERASFIRQQLAVDQPNWIAGVMYGLSTLGIGQGCPMHPLAQLTDAQKKRVNECRVLDISSPAQKIQAIEDYRTRTSNDRLGHLKD
jgi:4-hydroxy-tetrahydrodipicolinate synthase